MSSYWCAADWQPSCSYGVVASDVSVGLHEGCLPFTHGPVSERLINPSLSHRSLAAYERLKLLFTSGKSGTMFFRIA
jgi:hypothetical protein